MKELAEVSHELYEWIARNPMVLYYEGIPLHKFDKFELVLIISKFSSKLYNRIAELEIEKYTVDVTDNKIDEDRVADLETEK